MAYIYLLNLYEEIEKRLQQIDPASEEKSEMSTLSARNERFIKIV